MPEKRKRTSVNDKATKKSKFNPLLTGDFGNILSEGGLKEEAFGEFTGAESKILVRK